jgi:very-short-patch-repair endonuclease
MRAERSPRWRDASIAALAEGQHGVVARWQLKELGLGKGAIRHRLDAGRLHLVHRGVYAVGHLAVSTDGRWLAAVLAAGADAALSHRSAAAFWRVRETTRTSIEVTAKRRVRPCRGVEFHRAFLPPDERTVVRGVPVTTVGRTLLDLAAVLPAGQLERAVNEAEIRRLGDSLPLVALIERYPGRRGVGRLRAVIERTEAGSTITRSRLEDLFRDLVGAAGLPRPRFNDRVQVAGGWIEVDCLWRGARLIVELDGHAFHSTVEDFERDRARDRALTTAGWRVARVTWRQLHETPGQLSADLRRLLAAPRRLPVRKPR